ncbi:MAG: hypothetical protein SF028_11705 [Candidatus Sumerlaeia bacterium]|nr:hypothetical protein [Candidatus Sumerlaeia bacterium]
MRQSLRILLNGVVDYAGLFPPAKLELEPALRAYAAHRRTAEAWMLGHFVLPAARLPEVTPHYRELFSAVGSLPLVLIAPGGAERGEWLDAFRRDLQMVASLRAAPGHHFTANAFEARLPADVLAQGEAGAVRELLDEAKAVADDSGMAPFQMAVEATVPEGFADVATAAIAGLAEHRAGGDWATWQPPSFKLRCGGADAAAFPPADQVALALDACAADAVPIKFTAGLHHPLRRWDEPLGAWMHGFLNVLVAACLAHGARASRRTLVDALLREEHPAFEFRDDQLRVGETVVSADGLAVLRGERILGFGSCSFDEPRGELRGLGLL